jgi:hypothetical protein
VGIPRAEHDLGSAGGQAAALTVFEGMAEFLKRHDTRMIGFEPPEVNAFFSKTAIYDNIVSIGEIDAFGRLC